MTNSKSIKSGKYRHFKGGLYEVLGVGTNTETKELQVIYRPLTEGSKVDYWIRPYGMFFGEVESEGVVVKRFVKIND